MRLWTVHPKYLDALGLVALWREALLARAVLRGGCGGYPAPSPAHAIPGAGASSRVSEPVPGRGACGGVPSRVRIRPPEARACPPGPADYGDYRTIGRRVGAPVE